MAPGIHLAREIAGWLPGERRIGRTKAFAALAVAARAWFDAAIGIAIGEQGRRHSRLSARFEWQRRVKCRYANSIGCAEPARDPAHFRVLPAAVGVRLELKREIACIEAGQSGRTGAVALAPQTMAGETGVLRTRMPATQCNHLAGPGEALAGACAERHASGEDEGREGGEAHALRLHRHRETCAMRSRFPASRVNRAHPFRAVAALALAAAACKPPPEESRFLPLADATRGKQAIERVGCGSCHTIEGVRWPQGRAGPDLRGFAERAMIAGRVPNRPDVLAAFVRDAPAVAPGTTMPAMPLTEQESRDVAAYLYELGD